jgi:hypothetical protein
MALSFIDYTVRGPVVSFMVPFPYIAREHITTALINMETGVETAVAFEWLSDASIHVHGFPTGIPEGSKLRIKRTTPQMRPIVLFSDGSFLTSEELNTLSRQLMYLVQEYTDVVEPLKALEIVPAIMTDIEVFQQATKTQLTLWKVPIGSGGPFVEAVDIMPATDILSGLMSPEHVKKLAQSLLDITATNEALVAEVQERLDAEEALRDHIETMVADAIRYSDEKDALLEEQIKAFSGGLFYIESYDFGTTTPTQEQITAYALTHIDPLRNGVSVINLADNREWTWNSVGEKWVDVGISAVNQAQNGVLGVVKGISGNTLGTIGVNSDGTMVANGLATWSTTTSSINAQQTADITALKGRATALEARPQMPEDVPERLDDHEGRLEVIEGEMEGLPVNPDAGWINIPDTVGIMFKGPGSVPWSDCVEMLGQRMNKAEYPELWEFAQQSNAIVDFSTWQVHEAGDYNLFFGNEDSTYFRLPHPKPRRPYGETWGTTDPRWGTGMYHTPIWGTAEIIGLRTFETIETVGGLGLQKVTEGDGINVYNSLWNQSVGATTSGNHLPQNSQARGLGLASHDNRYASGLTTTLRKWSDSASLKPHWWIRTKPIRFRLPLAMRIETPVAVAVPDYPNRDSSDNLMGGSTRQFYAEKDGFYQIQSNAPGSNDTTFVQIAIEGVIQERVKIGMRTNIFARAGQRVSLSLDGPGENTSQSCYYIPMFKPEIIQ